MSWALLEKLLGEVATHSTLIGKYWFSFLFVFRVIVVLSVGDKVYSDEQSKFVCNTLQPGCDNICFNQFSPISHIRFWAMQILLVSLPSVIFIVWAMHSLSITKEKREKLQKLATQVDVATEPMERDPDVNPTLRHRYSDAPPNYNSTAAKNENEIVSKSKKSRSSNRRSEAIYNNELPGYNKGLPVAEVVPVQTVIPKVDLKQIKDPPILAAYVLHIYFRMAIEASFIALQYILFQFYVPEMYRCQGYPCPQRVECFISRPMEKNVFLIFMYVISGVCLVMDFMEVNYFGFRKCVHLIRGKKSGTYLREFEARWHTDPVLAGRFNPTRGGYGLRRHRDLSITDGSGDEYRSVETSDDGSGFE
uniref:gap junction beta-1 protein-like n=1 Tax=Ciona intestinalis TaxID=7719 RepID=UPI000180BD4E|nr:gap junction beta-1 protein-like [Ciona intestinalis]|eukprot:XP_009859883.1 gap junction beta-1 protein-like [Ciona intestinalis]